MITETRKELYEFLPAEYRPGKDSHIRYYAYNPNTMKLQRMKIRLNRINFSEREKYANHLVKSINKKLYNGWTPFKLAYSNKGTKMMEAIEAWRSNKLRDLRASSLRSYNSLSQHFVRWLVDNDIDIYVSSFESAFARKYMNSIAAEHKIRTYNSYLGCIKGMFHWFVANDFCRENPFSGIKKRKPEEKSRQIIDQPTRHRIDKWLLENNPQLHLASSLLFYCLIRPNEITFLKLKDFDFKNKSVWIGPEASKNKKGDRIAIPDTAIQSIQKQIEKLKLSDKDYVFSNKKTLAPGLIRMDSRYFAKHWNAMRKQLDFPLNCLFYSLKDTGIVQMLTDGVPPNEVMIQARHSDLKTTTEYLKHVANHQSQHFVRTKTTAFAPKT